MKKMPTIYPYVDKLYEPLKPAAGKFVASMPTGVTLHYTADRDVNRTLRTLEERRLGYHLIIERNGKVLQSCYLDRRVNHAGPSLWNGQSCNRFYAAVALVSWGELAKREDKFYAWNGLEVQPSEVVQRPYNIGGSKGYWDAATPAQERTLLDILRWFLSNRISYQAICGHDESASPPGRKIDPGGVIRWTMDELRTMLKPTTVTKNIIT